VDRCHLEAGNVTASECARFVVIERLDTALLAARAVEREHALEFAIV
jgi:hypothetical protein